jgi:multidrug efflux pump subunit AcrA (membrane-fusion protein)
MKRKGKIPLWLIVTVVLAIIAGGVIVLRNVLHTDRSEETLYSVRWETYENIIEISGNIAAANEQKFQAAGEGTVQRVYVKEGDVVKKDAVLITLDTTQQEYNLAKHDYDEEQKRITGSPRRELELMKTEREVLVKRVEERRVTARFDGIVAKLDVDPGDYVIEKDEMGVLLDRSYLKAVVEVVETDAGKLRVGQTVQFSFPAYTPEMPASRGPITGTVVSFSAVGRITDRGATVVDTEIRIYDPPNEILTGYSFTGKIEITAPLSVVLVERQAIGYESGKAFAERILPNGSTEKVQVQVEPYGTQFVQIVSGLSEGDMLRAQSIPASGGGPGGRSGGSAGPGMRMR